MIPASELSHADYNCLILAHHSLSRIRCLANSWLDHKRLLTSKRLADNARQKKHPRRLSARVLAFSKPNRFTRYQLPRNGDQSDSPPHILIDISPTPNQCLSYIMTTFIRRITRMCIIQQPKIDPYESTEPMIVSSTTHRPSANFYAAAVTGILVQSRSMKMYPLLSHIGPHSISIR